MAPTVRDAGVDDLADLVELRRQMFEDIGANGPAPWEEPATSWFARALDAPLVKIVVVADGPLVLSCGMGELHEGAPSPLCPSGRTVHVSNMVTRPSVRRRGYAQACLASLLDWARDEVKADRVELHASDQGRPMYERSGFVVHDRPAMRLRFR